MLYENIILTKKEKFQKLYRDIRSFTFVHSFFRGVYPNVEAKLSAAQLEAIAYLQEIFSDNKRDEQDIMYEIYSMQALQLLKEICEIIPKPITFANGYEMNPLEEHYSFIHNPEHNGFHVSSSFTSLVEDTYQITKHNDTRENKMTGGIICITPEQYNIVEWLSNMGAGVYDINGYRFDVIRYTGYIDGFLSSISIPASQEEEHPIMQFVSLDTNYEVDSYEVKCHHCKDGGCIHCDFDFFF